MLEDPFGDDDSKMERLYLRRVIGIALILGVVLGLALYAGKARAEAKYHAPADNGRVILFDDKCALPEVSNLPFKAEWHENGKVFQDCWSPPHPAVGVVMAYFTDKTVVGLPAQMFKKLTSV